MSNLHHQDAPDEAYAQVCNLQDMKDIDAKISPQIKEALNLNEPFV
jgi:hypothetical protein